MSSMLHSVLNKLISSGDLKVQFADGATHTYGNGTAPHVTLAFHNKAAERAIALDPELKLGECFMDGDISFPEGDIYSFLRLVFENTGPTAAKEPWMRVLTRLRKIFRPLQQMNTLARSSRNVQRHYDLSGELYDLFLDPDKQYSCAYFETPQTSLAEAQLAKKRHIAAKLQIKPEDKLLDIGCGWGGLGLYFAEFLDADVTGVTLSQEQFQIANQRAKESGLNQQAQFLLQDYRELNQQFDRISSVGMFEHVGVTHYAEFFQQVARLLKPDGSMLLHSIGRSDEPSVTNPFIRKYIFPGGYIPSLSEVLPHIENAGLIITDIEILRLHYAETLKAWREAFMANRDKAKAIYDERFCRMWEFYLAGSESAFRWQNMMVFQIQLAHRQDAVPLTRNYIEQEEKRLKRLEMRKFKACNDSSSEKISPKHLVY
ncbi:class I SAM-dependent methyltransferase [Pseudochrobactrum algeriensis]|uniref:SAM-dependent methyltransferase n=1 Tax=Pseudochrobactrum algeriensis TaxID=2834768 RepID=UPI001BD11818|nr:cyclopropane-fatty-acyl-phospholipid synthase family protein [Pseudochrobactrum algeriensis]MBX8813457.1 class I SAM-dependent methyltransferase [Ochrobactrum sp. MR34]QVQ37692.1 class I SAM-dependent methyltransferase [Pseudochrobactrum algeriensis]QVQ40912.1 class I SAM-dependent methyltransferase [Pseudochrobactrum algeriensis]QVQ44836.1 class I SAM-dependent methyltransferase [Pseudochrobactrum algeriensis]